MSWLVGAVPGLVAMAALLLFLRGYHLMRTDPAVTVETDDLLYLRQSEREQSAGTGLLTSLSYRVAARIRDLLPDNALLWLRRQVDMAGRPDGLDVDAVLANASRWLIILSPLMVGGVLTGQPLYVALSIVIVVVLPLARLSGQAARRRDQIDSDLPDFLDVLAVTVSAGMGFRSALHTVAERFGGPLADEVQTVLHQISNGASVRSAFANMRARTRSEAVDEFVTAYLQSEELGAPLVDTLNQIAEDMRRATAQRLRQRASRVEPRISLIMTLVLIPAAVIILVAGMAIALDFGGTGGLFGQ